MVPQKTRINKSHEKHSLILWEFRVPIWQVNICSKLFVGFCLTMMYKNATDCHVCARPLFLRLTICLSSTNCASNLKQASGVLPL